MEIEDNPLEEIFGYIASYFSIAVDKFDRQIACYEIARYGYNQESFPCMYIRLITLDGGITVLIIISGDECSIERFSNFSEQNNIITGNNIYYDRQSRFGMYNLRDIPMQRYLTAIEDKFGIAIFSECIE
jgi:hypothetical protein